MHRLAEAERRLNEDVALVEPALQQIQHLNDHARRIAAAAELSKDFATAIAALREVRHGIELLAKLTGELDPWRNTLAEDTRIQVEIIRVESTPLPKPARSFQLRLSW